MLRLPSPDNPSTTLRKTYASRLSPQSNDQHQQPFKKQGETEDGKKNEEKIFGRQGSKVYYSMTRKSQTGAQMQILSQNSTSTDDSVNTNLSTFQKGLKLAVQVNNFLSENSAAETEHEPQTAKKSKRERKEARVEETLPEIAESTT